MRRILLLAVTVVLYTITLAQDIQDSSFTKKPNTNLEKFNLKTGSIIRKEFIEIYKHDPKGWLTIPDITAKVLKLKDGASSIEISGIIISTFDLGSKYSSGRTYTAYIDADEIPSMLKFFEFIESLKDKTETNYTEYIFNSRDLQLFAYYSQGSNKKWEWHYGIETNKYYSGSRVNMDLKAVLDLKNSIQSSLSHFKAETTYSK
jgi:hypothetical protein